ncbi:hypothetical protein BC826DRAFT_1174214 [Russula brevipes]|nr:hypothetical protein BC826DRAFT_1174214 [Russula brevipes]
MSTDVQKVLGVEETVVDVKSRYETFDCHERVRQRYLRPILRMAEVKVRRERHGGAGPECRRAEGGALLGSGQVELNGGSKARPEAAAAPGGYKRGACTSADHRGFKFPVAVTSPTARTVSEGFNGKVPRTPAEFATAFLASSAGI